MLSSEKTCLLSNVEVEILQDIVCKRDRVNEGVSRKEAVQLGIDIGQAKSIKQAENHLDYLIREQRLPKLKRDGRTVLAQTTTTERSQINVNQQLCWHFMIDAEWEHLRKVNTPSEKFVSLQEHFQFNIDESCFMCSDSVLKIIGDGSKKKHDKNTSDMLEGSKEE